MSARSGPIAFQRNPLLLTQPTYPFSMLAFGCSHEPSEYRAASLAGTASTAATTICDHIWMSWNLDAVAYRNSDPIPEVQDPQEWVQLTMPSPRDPAASRRCPTRRSGYR